MHGARVCEGRERPAGTTTRPQAASEGGWALLEVVVAAAVLAIAVLAILAGLDASARTSGNNRVRTVASALAEQDLERMRGMRAEQLADYHPQPRAATVAGVRFRITSSAGWVRDDSGADATCEDAASRGGAYLRLSARVERASGPATPQPVVLTSLMAPPPGAGQLAVRVRSSADAPVVGQPVSVTGPASDSAPTSKGAMTNASGCAVFPYLTAGSYTVAMTGAGYVDKAGASPAQTQVNVTPATTTTATLTVDRAAGVRVQVQTKVGAAAPQPDAATAIVAANPGIQPSGLRLFTPQAPSASVDLEALYPFASGYTLYTGCAASDPTRLGHPAYFTQHPEAVPKPAPGAQYVAATVREPALNVIVRRNGAPVQSAHVVVTSQTCGDKVVMSTDANGRLTAPGPGMPFGTYDVCADDDQSRTRNTRYVRTPPNAPIPDINPNGTADIVLDVATSPGAGIGARCA